jgi:uncharacterized protein with FMN-binding domain
MKKLLLVLGLLVAIMLLGVLAFVVRYRSMASRIGAERIERVDLSRIPDGAYEGRFDEFLVGIHLTVQVADHRITAVEVLSQKSGKGYEALETIDRVIAAQSLDVDAVSGATGSSKVILIAIQQALGSAPRTEPELR